MNVCPSETIKLNILRYIEYMLLVTWGGDPCGLRLYNFPTKKLRYAITKQPNKY